MWFSTVRTLIFSVAATSLLESPAATAAATSNSRALNSLPGSLTGAAGGVISE
jgi:hypothetical protein